MKSWVHPCEAFSAKDVPHVRFRGRKTTVRLESSRYWRDFGTFDF